MSKSSTMEKVYNALEDFEKDYEFDFSDTVSYLGGGAYGDVWKAYDIHNNKLVAIKIGTDLLKEFEAAKSLKHKNIAQYEACYRIADKKAGTKDYAIMQYYPDGNLHQLLKKDQLSINEKENLILDILEGLQYLHKSKRIHRDFKPSNILIAKTPKGTYVPLIADFGLTKVVQSSDHIDGSDVELSDGRGTLSYKAPEQFMGGTAHYNLDLWAFGVVLYEMMTGELPFKRGDSGSEQSKIAEQQRRIVNVDLPEKLNSVVEPIQTIIRKCLIKDIHKRVRNERELMLFMNEYSEKLNNAIVDFKNKKYETSFNAFTELIKHFPANEQIQLLFTENENILRRVNELFHQYDNAISKNDYEKANSYLNEILKIYPENKKAIDVQKQILDSEKTDENQQLPKTTWYNKFIIPLLHFFSIFGFIYSLFGIYFEELEFNSYYVNFVDGYNPYHDNVIVRTILLILTVVFFINSVYHLFKDIKYNKRVLVEFSCIILFLLIFVGFGFFADKIGDHFITNKLSRNDLFERMDGYFLPTLLFGYFAFYFQNKSNSISYKKLTIESVKNFYENSIFKLFLNTLFAVAVLLNFGYSSIYILIISIGIYYSFSVGLDKILSRIMKIKNSLTVSVISLIIVYLFTFLNISNSIYRFDRIRDLSSEFYISQSKIDFQKLTWVDAQFQKAEDRYGSYFLEGYSEVNYIGNWTYRAHKGNKYALLGSDGYPLTKFIFDYIGDMEGEDLLVSFQIGELTGFMNNVGKIIINPQFTGDVTMFKNGKAKIYPEGMSTGYFFEIDKNGNKQE